MFINFAEAVKPPGDRPSHTLINDNPDCRMVALHLAPGQAIPPHSNPSTVLMIVVGGEGRIQVGEEIRHVTQGHLAICPPQVNHGLEAGPESSLEVLAVLTPRTRPKQS